LAGVLRSGFVVFVSDDVRVKKLNLVEAMEISRLSEVGGAVGVCAVITSRSESLRGVWLVWRLRVFSSYSVRRSAVESHVVSQGEERGERRHKERYTYADAA
jgi:hypothetical protein